MANPVDNNPAYLTFDNNDFTFNAVWQNTYSFSNTTEFPTQPVLEALPQNWYPPETVAPRWSSTDFSSTPVSSCSPGECGSPQILSFQLGTGAAYTGPPYSPMDSGLLEMPQISVRVVTAADRSAVIRHRRQQQNRNAQRTFRQRRQRVLEMLGSELEQEKQKVELCRTEVERLITELEQLRKLLQTGNASKNTEYRPADPRIPAAEHSESV
ncbi:hypothetical protein BP6252_09602 [Coleophoma cylindrospora]|uniref:BZIP domain-containing protein n=1 Tax=Coleophoma cylindrospora TaxID=1849047 RepID=A0A3D8QW21_9HELO|nr:hypothetical protein BP6252_09602 [Coleophoma cylindrospora]